MKAEIAIAAKIDSLRGLFTCIPGQQLYDCKTIIEVGIEWMCSSG